VSTVDAYSWLDRDRGSKPAPRDHDKSRLLIDWLTYELRNDLQAAVARRHPEVRRIVTALRRAGASHASMTGSGSAVFGLFSGQSAALGAAAALHRPGRRTLVTRTLDRAAYQRLAGR